MTKPHKYLNRLPEALLEKLPSVEEHRTLFELCIAALTLWGEARGEGTEGMAAVAWTLRNRREDRRWPNNIVDVCLQPWQFSCWNDNDANRDKLIHVGFGDKAFRDAYGIAAMTFITDLTADVSSGANHYLHWSLARDRPPKWFKWSKVTEKIKRHIFLKL